MCGIAAILGKYEDNAQKIKEMADLVSHRGPDGEGFFTDQQLVALGHRRLSIIDLTQNGHQPMVRNHLVITYNGEVYNYLELRQELTNLGHNFNTQSDTEVILASYQEWGADCLNKFNGMFAFVIYDQIKKKVFVARDRFGVKPLYFRTSLNGTIFIGSEIKQFSCLPDWKADLNFQIAHDFLNYSLLDHTSETFFQNVLQLKPGHFFEVTLNSNSSFQPIRQEKWYSLKTGSISTKDISAQFLKLFEDSVSLRLRSDVAVGSCLSGGLDSSSIVCTLDLLLNRSAKGKNNPKQKTFSSCSDIKKFDEKEFIDEVVNATNIDAHYVYPNSNKLFEILEKLIWHQDEPFGSTSIFAQWCVFEIAKKENVKVMLDGQGADEQLAGYHSYFPIFWLHLFRSFSWPLLLREIAAAKAIHGYSYTKAIKMMIALALPPWALAFLRRRLGHNSKDFFSFPVLVKKENPLKAFSALDSIAKASFAQIFHTNLQMLLHWEDRNSMAHSVEARVPFLDYRLVEFNLSLPDKFKLHGGVTKVILRDAMKGILPEKIRMRMDKLGFVTPESIWATQSAPETFRAKLQEAVDLSNGIVKPEILDYFERAITGEKTFDFVIWRALCFGAWIKAFNVNVKLALPSAKSSQ